MHKFLSVAGAAAIALGLTLAAAAPSLAAPPPHHSNDDAAGAAVIGGVLGFMAGAAAANGGPVVVDAPHHHHFGNAWRIHVAACEDDYGWRYDADTDLVRMHGHYFQCDD